jgi:hypothetical protein
MWRLNITLDEVVQHNLFSNQPFRRANSKIFFQYVRKGSVYDVDDFLRECPWHAFDIDYV